MLFEEIQGPESLYACGTLGGIGELAGGSRMLINGNSRVGRVGCLGRSLGMIVCLDPAWSLYVVIIQSVCASP